MGDTIDGCRSQTMAWVPKNALIRLSNVTKEIRFMQRSYNKDDETSQETYFRKCPAVDRQKKHVALQYNLVA